MQISSPVAQASPRSQDATNRSPFNESGIATTSASNRSRRNTDAESLSSADRPASDELEETDERGTEGIFKQLLDDAPPEPAVDFQDPQETQTVDDQLTTELPNHIGNVLPFSGKAVSDKTTEASRFPQQLPVGQSPLPLETALPDANTAPTDIDISSIDTPLGQVEYLEIEPISGSDFSDTSSFEQPSATSASTPQRDLPALPTGPASHQEVTQTVAETIVQQAQLTEVGESKQLTLQLHPAELGQVTLQIDWETDSLKVKIIANESAANEILNQNKSELIAALAEEGIDFDSLDVSYRDAQSEPQEDHNKKPRSQQLAPELFASPTDSENTETTSANRSSNLDITA